MNTMCLNVSKVSVCKRFRITKSVVPISLLEVQSGCAFVCQRAYVGVLMNLREALAGLSRL